MPTATDLANLVRCAHRVYLDANGDPSEKVPASGFLQLLWENGRAHEETVIAALPITEAPTRCDPSQRASETLQLMRAGTELIYHGLLRSGDLVGEPDLLERVAIPSALGDFSYIPVEIKNAGAFEDDAGERPKESYLAQLSAYAELLEHTQGVRPSTGKIIDSSGKQSWLPLPPIDPGTTHFARATAGSLQPRRSPVQAGNRRATCVSGSCAAIACCSSPMI